MQINRLICYTAFANYTVHFGEVALVAVSYDRLRPRQEKINAW